MSVSKADLYEEFVVKQKCSVFSEGRNFIVFDCNGKKQGFEVLPDYRFDKKVKSLAVLKPTDKYSQSKPDESIKKALSEAFTGQNLGSITDYIGKNDEVIIKVNLGSGIFDDKNVIEETVTHPDVVSAVIDYIRESIGKDTKITIAEADSTWVDMNDRTLEVFGYKKMIEDKIKDGANISFLNLTKTPRIPFKFIGVPGIVPISEEMVKPNTKIISIATMKRHASEGVTGVQKNMFGALPENLKIHYHMVPGGTASIIAPASRIMRPVISINEGVIGCAADHGFCIPVNFKHFIVSNDMVCADKHIADIMDFPYNQVPHLKLNIDAKEGDPFCPLVMDSGDSINNDVWKRYSLPPEVLKHIDNFWIRMSSIAKNLPVDIVRAISKDVLHPAVSFFAGILHYLSNYYYPKKDEVRLWLQLLE